MIGGSGSGKTRFFVKPNLMQLHSSYVVTDPKGTLILETGSLLVRAGYKVKVLNTINFKKSMHYNPFAYLRSEKDILKLTNTIIANTKGDGEKSSEDFWVKAERLLYCALIGYIWYEAPEEEKNFITLLEMINASEAREDDEEFQSPVDLMFSRLEEKEPDHFAVKQYKKYKLAAGVVCSKRLLNQAVGKSLRTHNLKPKKGAQVMRKSEKITALYERLSRDDFGKDDDQQRESNSISNQKAMLEEFAARQGFTNIVHFTDDGISGTCFDRPGFLAMMKEVEAGNVEYLCIKDMSRMGRDYLKVGQIMEILRQRGVRLIAINDGVDSARGDDDFTPFRNIMNDMYSRDISKKVLAGRMTRSRQGKFCGGQPPLGLMRDPEDKGHLIRDPETAPVIRKIYDMALDGWGCMRIAKQLMDDKVPITRVKSNTECDVNYYSWGSARISHILRNPFYKGAHLVCRTHQKGIRSNTYDIIPREDWEIIEDCHEAIISPEEWEQVQEIIDRRPTIMKGNSCPFYNLFHGIIYCATCGKSMQVRYEKVGRTGKNRFTGEQREPIDKAYYICQTYNRLGKNACTSHKIEARDLYNLVLKDIQELAKTALKDADAFYQRLSSRMERRYLLDASQTQKECQRLESRNREIDEMFLSLYTDKAKGILTEQRFMKLTATLEQEQEANQKRLQDLLLMMRHSDEQENEVRTFIKEIRRYAAIEELDEAVLNRLISKILVGEVKKIDGQKVQEVRIVYNFVGEIPEITA